MKHISKKQFLEHGWRKGDRVRYVDWRGIARCETVTAINFVDGIVSTKRYDLNWSDILEIIPATNKKSLTVHAPKRKGEKGKGK